MITSSDSPGRLLDSSDQDQNQNLTSSEVTESHSGKSFWAYVSVYIMLGVLVSMLIVAGYRWIISKYWQKMDIRANGKHAEIIEMKD